MANQIYENGFKNLSEGGFFYRDTWYPNEEALNRSGFYIVQYKTLYKGDFYKEYKYQDVYYLVDSDYFTYDYLHSLGYSIYVSHHKSFLEIETGKYKIGYYNSVDGYYVDGTWYQTEQDVLEAGYEIVPVRILQLYSNMQNLNIQGGMVYSGSFSTNDSSYSRTLYLDSELENPYIYQGENIIWDLDLSGIIQNFSSLYKINSIEGFPNSTTSNISSRTDAFFILSENGTVQEPLLQTDIGKPIKHYQCTNYYSNLTISANSMKVFVLIEDTDKNLLG